MRRVGITLSPRARRNVGIAALVLTAIGLPEWLVIGTWTERATLRRQWTVSGSACPIVDKPDRAVVGRRSPQYFTYEGVRFGRQFGEVSCAAPPTGNPLTRRATPSASSRSPRWSPSRPSEARSSSSLGLGGGLR